METQAEYIAKPKRKKSKRKIQREMLVGYDEFAEAFGIMNPRTIEKLMKVGMPYYPIAPKITMYDPNEVKDWIKENFKPQTVKAL